jgi:adenine deaminase
LCSDDLHPYDMRHTGHIDHNIQLMIQAGFDPIQAISMATINSAQCYRLYKRGAIAPGYIADMVIFEDLNHLQVSQVYKNGKLVAKDHQALFDASFKTNQHVTNTIHLSDKALDFTMRLKDDLVWVIGLIKNNVSTHKIKEKVVLENSVFHCKNNPGLLKLAVIERHHKTGNIGLGIVKGYGLKHGAVAMTVAHDSHNIICLGDSDEDMVLAVKEIKSMGGGIVLVSNRKVIGNLQLDVGGIMSSKSADYVIDQLRNLEDHIKTMGLNPEIEDPFLQLAFLSLPVIPHLKVTDLGLFDVDDFKVIPMEVRENL